MFGGLVLLVCSTYIDYRPPGDLKRFLDGQRQQDARHGARQQRLAGAGRACQQDVVTGGSIGLCEHDPVTLPGRLRTGRESHSVMATRHWLCELAKYSR